MATAFSQKKICVRRVVYIWKYLLLLRSDRSRKRGTVVDDLFVFLSVCSWPPVVMTIDGLPDLAMYTIVQNG